MPSLTDALLLDPYKFHVWISVRTDGGTARIGSGTIADPYQVGSAATFDTLMGELAEDTTVHLGPTTATYFFKTNGYADGVSGGWSPKKGMRIIGSGIDVTTLQLEGGTTASKLYFAVGHALGSTSPQVDFFEISDLTINCNLAGLGASVAAGAVRIMGNHSLIKRVKAKNWGTKVSTVDCFVFSVITANVDATASKEVANSRIEDCIAVTPAGTTTTDGETAIFYAGGKYPADVTESYGTNPRIRNCYADSTSPDYACLFRGLWMSSCRGGVIEGNQIHNTRLGLYQDNGSARDVAMRQNWFRNVAYGMLWKLGTLSSSTLTINDLDRAGVSGDNAKIAVATVNAGHGLSSGERVRIDSATAPSAYKGIFVVKAVLSSTQFQYQMASDPGSDNQSGTAQKIYGMANLLVEENTVELATNSTQYAFQVDDAAPAPITPDYVHGQVVIRRNKIRYFDSQFDATYQGSGIQVRGVKNLNVQDNIVDSAVSNPIRHERCGSVTYFNNRTPAGALIRGYDGAVRFSELETDADDALLLAIY